MHIVVVGGGSAGHVLPARPIIQHYLDQGAQVSFIGTGSGLEADLVQDLGISFYPITAGKLRRYLSWANVVDVFKVLLGIVQALALVLRLRPTVVFSKGGFVSLPVVFAAWCCRVPVVAHESDLSPGLANRLVKPFVRTFCVSFAATHIGGVRVVHTGTPIRTEILQGDAIKGREHLKIDEVKPLMVVTGGSLGADRLNGVVFDAMENLCEHYYVLHVVGHGKATPHHFDNYTQLEYVDQGWGDILAAADVVVSRAGANALFEFFALRKKCILVPLSMAASRGDQIENANYAERAGLAVVIREEAFDPTTLTQGLEQLRSRAADYTEALGGFTLPDATATIVAEIDKLA